MRGLKLKSMSFDDLVALRDSVLRLISDKAASARRELEAKLSAIEMVGNTIGMAPASMTPRFTASIRSGTLPWQGL